MSGIGSVVDSLLWKVLTIAVELLGVKRFGDHYVYLPALSEESIIVDLGANRGSFYSTLSSNVRSIFYAVEACPTLWASLPSHPKVHTFNCAIHNTNQHVVLNVSVNPEANSVHREIAARYGIQHQVAVEGCTLDRFISEKARIDHVDLLKMDIEGAEIEMFDSTSDADLQRIGQNTGEFHDFLDPSESSHVRRIIRRLRNLGFTVLVFSANDHRQVLMLNMSMLALGFVKRTLVVMLLIPILSLRRIRSSLSLWIRTGRSPRYA